MSGKLYDIHDSSIPKHQHLYGLSKTAEERKAKSKAVWQRKKLINQALNMGHKLCTECNTEKTLKEFHVDKTTYTGYSSWCKSCKKEYNQRYRKNYTENTEKV